MTTKLHSRTKRDTAAVTRMTFTTHVVDIDVADLLGDIDVTDGQVIVEIRTPSGRSKRVTLAPSFLIPPHHDAGWGTCEACGATCIALNAEGRCVSCR